MCVCKGERKRENERKEERERESVSYTSNNNTPFLITHDDKKCNTFYSREKEEQLRSSADTARECLLSKKNTTIQVRHPAATLQKTTPLSKKIQPCCLEEEQLLTA